jgi:hypothetical protein
MSICSIDDVRKAQAYILIYTRCDPTEDTSSPVQQVDEEVSFNYKHSLIPKFNELKRKLNLDAQGRYELKRRRTTIW